VGVANWEDGQNGAYGKGGGRSATYLVSQLVKKRGFMQIRGVNSAVRDNITKFDPHTKERMRSPNFQPPSKNSDPFPPKWGGGQNFKFLQIFWSIFFLVSSKIMHTNQRLSYRGGVVRFRTELCKCPFK
jgi:hypothetical protein